jgi:hypothetical protein
MAIEATSRIDPALDDADRRGCANRSERPARSVQTVATVGLSG